MYIAKLPVVLIIPLRKPARQSTTRSPMDLMISYRSSLMHPIDVVYICCYLTHVFSHKSSTVQYYVKQQYLRLYDDNEYYSFSCCCLFINIVVLFFHQNEECVANRWWYWLNYLR